MRQATWTVFWALQSLAVTYSASVPALVVGLSSRGEDSCADPRFSRCPDLDLPSNFCCPKSSTCISADESSTLICCPEGKDCTTIQPITCDIQRQNVLLDPSSVIKTTRLSEALSACGKGCCPHGYACENGSCKVDTTSSKTVSSTSTTPSMTTATSEPTPSGSPIATMSATPVPIPSLGDSSDDSGCPEFPGGAVAAGFFPGMVAGILMGMAFCYWQNRRQQKNNYPSGNGHFRHRSDDNMILSISDPIPTSAQDSVRTDFLRHHGSHENQQEPRSMRERASTRVRSFFAPKLTLTVPDASTMPVTPPQQIYPRREPSTESIKVYSPIHLNEGNARPSRNINARHSRPPTTFSDMMERVGFQNGQGSPFYPVGETPHQPAPRRFYQNESTLRPVN